MEAPTEVDQFEVLPEERQRILAGDYGPLHRSDMPKCERGDVHVLSQSRPSQSRDKEGNAFTTKPERLVWMTVKRVTRRSKGGWSVSFDLTRRESDRYLRPVAAPVAVDKKGRPLPMTVDEELGYTSNPQSRLAEQAPSVPADYQNVLAVRAREQRAEAAERDRGEELARAQIRSITEMLREMAVQAARTGHNINPLLASLMGQIKAERMDRAA